MRSGDVIGGLILVAVIGGLATLAGLSGVAEHNRTVRATDERWEKQLVEKGYGTYKGGKFEWKETVNHVTGER